jgi:hypothetical protein
MTVNQDLTLSNVINRVKAPTPSFYKKLRTIGLLLASIGGALLAAPAGLPVILTTAAGYIFTAGSVMTAVAQTVTPAEKEKTSSEEDKTEGN